MRLKHESSQLGEFVVNVAWILFVVRSGSPTAPSPTSWRCLPGRRCWWTAWRKTRSPPSSWRGRSEASSAASRRTNWASGAPTVSVASGRVAHSHTTCSHFSSNGTFCPLLFDPFSLRGHVRQRPGAAGERHRGSGRRLQGELRQRLAVRFVPPPQRLTRCCVCNRSPWTSWTRGGSAWEAPPPGWSRNSSVQRLLPRFRLFLSFCAADLLKMSSFWPRAELTSEYAATRKQFSKSLAEFGMIQVSAPTRIVHNLNMAIKRLNLEKSSQMWLKGVGVLIKESWKDFFFPHRHVSRSDQLTGQWKWRVMIGWRWRCESSIIYRYMIYFMYFLLLLITWKQT